MIMMGYGWMSGFGLFGMIFSLVVIVGIVVLVVWAVNRMTARGNYSAGGQSPREILQARYARGEITREQYQEILKDLS